MPTDELQTLNPPNTHFFRSLFVDNFVNEANRQLQVKLFKLSRLNVKHEHNHNKHFHTFFEIILPFNECYKCCLNGVELITKQSQALLIQPGDQHEDFYLKNSELLFIQLNIFDMFDRLWKFGIIDRSLNARQRIIDLSGDTAINSIINLLSKHKNNTASQLVAMGKLCEAIFWNLTALIPTKLLSRKFSKIMKHDEFTRLAEEYFYRHIDEKLDMKHFCSYLGMCRRAVEKKFAELFNDSPLNAFIKIKIKIAAEMLIAGKSIQETADSLGFGDQFYFSTVFKRVTGYPPSKQRKF